MKPFAFIINLLLAIIMLASTQPTQANQDYEQVKARAWGSTAFSSDMDGYDGGYSHTNAGLALSYRWFTLSYASNSYSWHNVDQLPFGNGSADPWQNLNMLDFDANFKGQFNQQVGWFAGGNVYSGWENDLSNSFGVGGRAGLDFDLGHNWRLRVGGFLMYHPVGLEGFPMVGISWAQNGADGKGWSFGLGSPVSMLQYRFSPLLAVRLSARYQYGVFRLADDSPVVEQGYVVPKSIVSGLYAELTPFKNFSLIAGLEGNLWRELIIYDDDGNERDNYDVDGGLGLALRLHYGF